MLTEIYMPKLGQTMEEGRVVRWLKRVGEEVARGEGVVEVETDKSIFEVEADGEGVLRKIFVEEDEIVPVAATLAFIAEPDEEVPDAPLARTAAKSSGEVQDTRSPTPRVSSGVGVGQVQASPAARRLAGERGIDLASITGTGPGGAISVQDVEKHLAGSVLGEAAGVYEIERREPMSSLRRRIAGRLKASVDAALHVSATVEIDAKRIQEHLEELSSESGTKITVTDMLVSVVAQALRDVPVLNSTCDGRNIHFIRNVNVGVAVAVPDGLLVPVIKNADAKSIREISAELRSLIERAKEGSLLPEDYTCGTFTISNLGMLGVESFTSIINPPETAILSVGAIVERVRVIGGQAAVRPVFKATLTIDHRVADGVVAAQFLGRLKSRCEDAAL